MTTTELELRIAALEKKVEGLSGARGTSTNKEWVLKMWGSFSDDPDFEKAMRFGRKWRETENRKSLRGNKSTRAKKNGK